VGEVTCDGRASRVYLARGAFRIMKTQNEPQAPPFVTKRSATTAAFVTLAAIVALLAACGLLTITPCPSGLVPVWCDVDFTGVLPNGSICREARSVRFCSKPPPHWWPRDADSWYYAEAGSAVELVAAALKVVMGSYATPTARINGKCKQTTNSPNGMLSPYILPQGDGAGSACEPNLGVGGGQQGTGGSPPAICGMPGAPCGLDIEAPCCSESCTLSICE
jgi:hypothetical protein